MAYSVRPEEVKEILDVDTDIKSLMPFIAGAQSIVDARLSSSGLSAGQLKEITRWLAAHFVCIRQGDVESEKVGDASIKYRGQTGLGLDFTSYGQQVKLLDTTGSLSQLGKRAAMIQVIQGSVDPDEA